MHSLCQSNEDLIWSVHKSLWHMKQWIMSESISCTGTNLLAPKNPFQSNQLLIMKWCCLIAAIYTYLLYKMVVWEISTGPWVLDSESDNLMTKVCVSNVVWYPMLVIRLRQWAKNSSPAKISQMHSIITPHVAECVSTITKELKSKRGKNIDGEKEREKLHFENKEMRDD